MPRNNSQRLPAFASLDELVEFFETRDLGEYWEHMPDASFEVDIQRRVHLFALDEQLAHDLTQIARVKQTSSQALIDTWLKEKILEQT